jgi:hypothetical protein
MCTRAGARSVASMSRRLIPLAAAAAMAAGAPPAQAAGTIYGGSGDGEPIVVTANRTAQKLSSAMLSWTAVCDDGMVWSTSSPVKPAASRPGFAPTPDEMPLRSNAHGRFSGERTLRFAGEGHVTTVVETFAGRLKPRQASGTLRAIVKITDANTGAAVASCDTGTVRWAALHAPGQVFGGSTSQNNPVVVRVDARRRRVTDVMVAWETKTCAPDAGFRIPDRFTNFGVSRSGAFGNPFTGDFTFDDGVHRHMAFDLQGRLTAHAVRGTLQVTMTDTDPNGAQVRACDTGSITWKAMTG